MIDDTLIKEDGGVRIKYYPSKIVVQGISVTGMNGLKMFTDFGRSDKGVRARYNISKDEWPNSRIQKMVDGSVYLVEFWKND